MTASVSFAAGWGVMGGLLLAALYWRRVQEYGTRTCARRRMLRRVVGRRLVRAIGGQP